MALICLWFYSFQVLGPPLGVLCWSNDRLQWGIGCWFWFLMCNPAFWFLILVWFHSVPNCRVQHGIHFDFNHFDFSICTHVLWSVIISISKIDNRWFLIPMLLILYHFDSHTRPWMMGLRRRRINSAFSHFNSINRWLIFVIPKVPRSEGPPLIRIGFPLYLYRIPFICG